MSKYVKVIDLGWNSIQQSLFSLSRREVAVGLFSKAIHRGGKKRRSKNSYNQINMLQLGLIHHFGSPKNNIPARPFIAQAFDNGELSLFRFAKSIVESIYLGADLGNSLNILAMIHVSQIKREFGSPTLAPNKPSTIARKGSSAPLIDGATLMKKIDYKIRYYKGK